MIQVLAAAATGLQVAGGIMKAFGARDEAEAKAREHQYRAQVARQNAAIARKNSEFALEAGESNARRSGMTTGFTIAKQKVGQAANGFDVNSGTNEAVRESTGAIGREDQTNIRTEFGRKALGERNRAVMLESDATMSDTAAQNARDAGDISVISTLLGTAGSVADKWLKAGSSFGGASSGITTYDENFRPTSFIST